MTLIEKLIVLRDKAGISQMALAHQLGVSRQAVSRWESGDATPSMDKLKALAKIYGVSLDWLCSDKCEFSENTEIERERKDAQEQIRNEELPVCKEKKFGKHRKLLIAIIGTIITALIFTLPLIIRDGERLKKENPRPVEDLTSDDISNDPEIGFDFEW